MISREDPRGDNLFGRESIACAASAEESGGVCFCGRPETNSFTVKKSGDKICVDCIERPSVQGRRL